MRRSSHGTCLQQALRHPATANLLLRALVTGATESVLLNVTRIPLYGMLAAAVATPVTESPAGGLMLA